VLGFGANSAASIGVTYWINPTESAKKGKEAIKRGAVKIFKTIAPERAINAGAEIFFMLISGTILTAVMAPLVKKREDMAYWINQKLGKDTDVLPEHLKTYDAPLTLEDKVEQELKKRVNYGQTSRDLWKARWSGIFVPLLGDPLLSKWNDKREAVGKWSTDTISWKAGQHLYDEVLPKSTVHKLSNFFEDHGAGINDMRDNNKVVFNNLERIEKQHDKTNQLLHGYPPVSEATRKDRMMIADQTRLLGKEVGWTLVLAEIVEKLTCKYQNRRIRREEDKALAKMREEGIIPVGVSVDTDKQGHVTLTTTKHYVPSTSVSSVEPESPTAKKWADDKVKKVTASALAQSQSHTDAVNETRSMGSGQSSLM
jgi:hypothetical protein